MSLLRSIRLSWCSCLSEDSGVVLLDANYWTICLVLETEKQDFSSGSIWSKDNFLTSSFVFVSCVSCVLLTRCG